jgi:hypothetical protein
LLAWTAFQRQITNENQPQTKIADNLKTAGWSLGYVSAVNREARTIWIVDAHRGTLDPAVPPADSSAIQAVAPSEIFNWQGPAEPLKSSSERIAAEQKRYALTGRVIELRAEEDGDLHIALADASGDKPGIVVAEIPAKPQWCELRQIVFGWTQAQFPFRVRSGRKLKLTQPPVITVIGKAFFDIGHAPADHSNRRTDLQGYAAWEIHPVMKLEPH